MADLYKDWFAAIQQKNPTMVQVKSQPSWEPPRSWLASVKDGFTAPLPTFSAPNFAGELKNINVPIRSGKKGEIFDPKVFIANGYVLNPGFRPPSEFLYNLMPPDKKSPFNWQNLVPTPESLKSATAELVNGVAKAGGAPISIDAQGNPVINPKEAGAFAVKAAAWLNEELHLNIDPRAFQILNEASKIDWPGVIEQMQALSNASLEALNTLASGVTSMTGVGAANAFGTASSVATGAIQIGADGYVSRDEAVDFGVNTGASIGASVGSYFYPPIGTAVGAGVGALVGFIVGSTVSVSPPSADPETFKRSDLAKRYRDINNEFSKLNSELEMQRWLTKCEELQGAFYETLQKLINETAVIWTEAEAQTGWRFNLRWFDPNPGFDAALLSKVLGVSKTVCNPRREQSYEYDPPSTSDWTTGYKAKPKRKIIFPGNCETYITCPRDYGCPYPDVDPVKYGFDGFKVRTAYEDRSRTASAFAMRGFKWLEKDHRPKCADLYNKTKDSGALLQMLAWQVGMLPVVARLISLDIHRTAIAVQTERDLWTNAATYIVKGIDFGVVGRAAILSKAKTPEEKARLAAAMTEGRSIQQVENKMAQATFVQNALWPTVGAAAVAYWFLGRK